MSGVETTILSLDVGGVRIGIALASSNARIAHPYDTLANNDQFLPRLKAIIDQEGVAAIVVGLPRNLDGHETAQTRLVEDFIGDLELHTPLPVYRQDEALTSSKAEAELSSRGKLYSKGDIDALAATYILEDFLQEKGKKIFHG